MQNLTTMKASWDDFYYEVYPEEIITTHKLPVTKNTGSSNIGWLYLSIAVLVVIGVTFYVSANANLKATAKNNTPDETS